MKSIIKEYWYVVLLILTPLLLILVCLLLFFLFVFIVIGKDNYINHLRINKFHEQHLNIAHTLGSEIIYEYKKVGSFEGNRDGCDLNTALVYKANVDYSAFRDFYRGKRISAYNSVTKKFDKESWFSTIEATGNKKQDFPKEESIDYGFIKYDLLQDDEFKRILEKEGTVYIAWSRNYIPSDLFLGCH